MTSRRLPALALCFLAGGSAGAADLTVSAAVSLKEPLAEVVREAGLDVDLHLGGSAALAHQLLRGAPSDVFVSASRAEVRRLRAAGLVAEDAVCAVAANELRVVFAARVEPPDDLAGLAQPRFSRIAVAHAGTSPLGRYTAEALASSGLAETLAPRLIRGQHARQVVDYVARGEVDAAFVYSSDALRFGDRIGAGLAVDPALHDPIVYQAAALTDAGRAFLERLCSAAAGEIFERYGFKAWSGPH